MAVKTWNYKKYNIVLEGIEITDLNGDATIEADEDLWEFVEGQNGSVERSLKDSKLITVTLPMQATSTQLDAIAGLDLSDRNANTGPYDFVAVDISRNFKLYGKATIMKIGMPSRSKVAPVRNVTLKIVADAAFMGA